MAPRTRLHPYVIARGVGKRPLTQHIRQRSRADLTLCGRRLEGWSIEYTDRPFNVILCLLCKRLQERGAE